MTDSASLRSSALRSPLSRLAGGLGQELVVLGALILLFVLVGLYNPRFLSPSNLNAIFAGNAYIAVAAIGMAMVIISGHIDVSVGSLIGVLATIAGTLATKGYPVWIAWSVPVLVGILINSFTGLLVAYANIPSIVVTLGMLSILKGALILATNGNWITNLPADFLLAQHYWFGLRSPIVIMVGLTILVAFWMRYFAFGRSIYAVGGNAEAARAAGIAAKPVTVIVFAIHGFFAGLAALLFATQLQVIQSTVPPGLELTVITAAVIGGVSILGGTGTVLGSTIAAMLFATITSALTFMPYSNVLVFWKQAIVGILILITVLADMIRRHRMI
ncbi:ABC transporter permease [Methylovirgula sp. 4M-Z18]|uniref:ABC transporter permease n=1 Tax=Methylovirgula sp. 4M-Z18 TaxID=2293567 RepID=UPI000E2FAEBF|nr:ABC transporter permease [Methylovirgula sp. 4M-Z18]RFB79037.1 ABC transporter permease [Methylovirgula sp. 4M-Z18]